MTALGRIGTRLCYGITVSRFFIFQILCLFVVFAAMMPALAVPPTNGELALLGTAVGDNRGTFQYRDRRRGHQNWNPRLFTDDTHKAAAIYAFFLEQCSSGRRGRKKQHQKKGKGTDVDVVRLAECQCFAAFPKGQRFGLKMEGTLDVTLNDYGFHHSRLLKRLFQGFMNHTINSREDVLNLSSQSFCSVSHRNARVATGSSGNGGCMGIATIVAILDHNPFISDRDFVHLVRETVQVSHHHHHATEAAVAIALAARASIDYRQERLANHDFAEITLRRIREHVTDSQVLQCLAVIERYIGNHSSGHGVVMAELNRLLPSSSDSERSRGSRDNMLRGLWAPSTAAAVLYFLFTGSRSQELLLQWVEQFTCDQDTVGAMLMALSALREGGFRRGEFSAELLQDLVNAFPPWVIMNRNADDYRLAEAGNDCFCQNQSM